jgi:allophanate hydrolase
VAERHAAVGEFVARGSHDLGPSVTTIVTGAGSITGSAYAADRVRLAELSARASRIWHEVDAVLIPTVPFHPTLDEVAADPIGVNLALGRFVTGANLVDWCGAAIPVRGLAHPVGVQLLGPAWSDEALWRAAATLLDEPLTDAPPNEGDEVVVAVLGAHLAGQPLNHQLTSRGGTLVEVTRSAPAYRMVVLDGPLPKPGLVRDPMAGASVELELWRLDHLGLGQFVTEIPAPLTIGTIELDDGRAVQGFLCESEAADSAVDISAFGGWRAWLARNQA